MNAQTKLPVVAHGGQAVAIIPQTMDEMWTIAKHVVAGGLAPSSLISGVQGNDKASAVLIAIMSGAELGLSPLVALRSFTVINGRPALYGDGLINVVRRSGKAEYIRSGYDAEKQIGWCEAKRNDTGEVMRREFSIEDAKRARLYVDAEKVERRSKSGGTYTADNDSPWYRYPQRMAPWRATGWCLRDLFADVLGGIMTDEEARSIPPDNIETVTVIDEQPAPNLPDIAPPPPEETTQDEAQDDAGDPSTPEEILARAENWFDQCADIDAVEAVWDQHAHFQETMPEADADTLRGLYEAAKAKFEPAA